MTADRRYFRIGILGGTGAQGTGLALRLARAGHAVTIGSRDADKARAAAVEASARVDRWIDGAGNRDAANDTEISILTVPCGVQRETVEHVLGQIQGKILVDATVPLAPPAIDRVQLPNGQSVVAAIQALAGSSVRVVSAFQNVSAKHLSHLDDPIDCDVLVCGDDSKACATVIDLCEDIGVRGLYAGSIANSAAAEALTSVLIQINRRYKVPDGAGIKVTGLPRA